MANFVNGGVPLNNGKSNNNALPVASDKGLTAAEWNETQSWLDDLRNWLVGAVYFGLAQSGEGVSATNKAKLRLASAGSGRIANTLQASINGGIFKSMMPDYIHVRDYGAVGDGSTNDATAIQAAFDAAFADGKPVVFDAKTYLVNSELKVLVKHVTVLGQGPQRTFFKAGAAMRAVLRLGVDSGETGADTQGVFRDFAINGNRNAKYGLMLLRCSNSTFSDVTASGCTYDGIYLANHNTDDSVVCINDNNAFYNCGASNNGTIIGTTEFDDPSDAVPDTRHVGYYVLPSQFLLTTGTVSLTSGSPTLTGSGTTFLTWGLRSGDPIRVGVSPNTQWFVIHSVDSETQLTLASNSSVTASARPWSCGRGSGYWEDGHADNNINRHYSGQYRSNAGFAMAFRGIYGPTCIGQFIDYHRYWAIRVGNNAGQYYSGGTILRSGTAGPCISPRFIGIYFEAIGRKPFYLRSVQDFLAEGCMDLGYETDPFDMNAVDCFGLYNNRRGLHDIKAWETNYTASTMVNYIPSKYMRDGLLLSTTRVEGRQYAYTSGWIVGTPILLEKYFNQLNPGGANRTMTATPHFVLVQDQIVIISTELSSGFNIILQDNSVLPGSKLLLSGSANVTLTPGSTISFKCDGTYWWEIARCIR